jgi:hypothetical protein
MQSYPRLRSSRSRSTSGPGPPANNRMIITAQLLTGNSVELVRPDANVAHAQASLSGADLAYLDVELERTGFDDLALRYRNRHCTAFDGDGVVIIVGRGEVVKQMIYDFGCVDRVGHGREKADYARVTSLANAIHKVAGVK